MWREPMRLNLTVAVAVVCAAVLQFDGAAAGQPRDCPGDCNGDGRVSIDELTRAVSLAVGQLPSADCAALDTDGDGQVSIGELIGAVGAALSGCGPPATPTPRPNFVIINMDDARADGIDRMPVVLSRLVGEGVTFRNAFVPDSLCCPSRASLYSGRYAVDHGTRQLDGAIGGAHTFRESGADRQTVAVWLHDAGYATGLFGKYLNAYSEEFDQGPKGRFYVPPGWSRWRAFVVDHYGGRDGPGYELVDESGGRTAYLQHDRDEEYSTDVLAGELRRFIADATTAGQPFLAVWVPFAPHVESNTLLPIPAARHLDAFAGLPAARPPNFAESDRSDKPRWVQALDESTFSIGATDLARRRAYETLLAVDDGIGGVLADLAALGIDDRTVIVLTSDNGVAWGEHGLMWQDKECPYEECLRVPMVVRGPRAVGGAGRAVDTPVLNIDVAATVMELAGVSVPRAIDGISFAPALAGASAWLRDDFLLEHWSQVRDALLVADSVPLDGDRLRVFFGRWPKTSLAFEFDSDGSVTPGSIAVPIGESLEISFDRLGATIAAHVPNTAWTRRGAQLVIEDTSPDAEGLCWLDEVNRDGRFAVYLPKPDSFGVRDVAGGFMYVENACGERELYDLHTDPWELENRAGAPASAAVRARLRARVNALLKGPYAPSASRGR